MNILNTVKDFFKNAYMAIVTILAAGYYFYSKAEKNKNQDLQDENRSKDQELQMVKTELHVKTSSIADLVEEHNQEIDGKKK